MCSTKSEKQPLQDFHAIQHKDKYIVLDINTSRCLEMTPSSYNACIAGEEDKKYADIHAEWDKLRNLGVFQSGKISPEPNEEDLIVHEVHLGAHTRCNLSCRYCYRHDNVAYSHKESLEQAIRIIDRTVEKFVQGKNNTRLLFNLGLTGEILLNLGFLKELNKYTFSLHKRLGVNIACCATYTNATLLNSGLEQEMWELSGMTGISVSIDGPKHIHDAVRIYPDGRGTYDDIEPNIRAIAGKRRVSASATLTGKMPYVTEIFTHLYDLGFDQILIKPIRTSPDSQFAINNENIENVKEEYTKFVQFLLSQDDVHILAYLSSISRYDMFGRFFYRLLKGERPNRRCSALLDLIGIDYNGNIYPCVSFIGMEKFNLGNIFDETTDWNEARMPLIRKFHMERNEECKVCWARNLCGGGCRNSALLANKSLDVPDGTKCKLIRHIAELSMIMLSEIEKRPEVMKALISTFIRRSPQSITALYPCIQTNQSPISNADMWDEANTILINRRDQFRGLGIPDDSNGFSGRLKTLWDSQYFYLSVDVEDKILSSHQGGQNCSDERRVFFALTESSSYMPWKYTIAMNLGRPVLLGLPARDAVTYFNEEVKDAIVSIERKGNITFYRVAVPWKALGIEPVEGGKYPFNMAIYDNSHPFKARTWYELAPGMIVESNPSLFAQIILFSKPEPT